MTAVTSEVTAYQTYNYYPTTEAANYQNSHPLLESHYQNYPYPDDLVEGIPDQAVSNLTLGTGNLSPLLETRLVSCKSQPASRKERYHQTGTDCSDAFGYYSPAENGDQTVLYYSGREKKIAKHSYPDESSRFFQQSVVKMGSGTSMMTSRDSNSKKANKKQGKNRSNSTSSSDNGGFESGTPKPVLGVKEKLRYSLDKISLKSPFRWSSSDKLSHNNSSGGSKSKNKNTRRYSDSSSALLSVNAPEDRKKKSGKKSSGSSAEVTALSRSKKIAAASRMVRPYSAGRSYSSHQELDAENKLSVANNHDYVNLMAVSQKALKLPSHATRTDECVFDPQAGRVYNEYCMAQGSNSYHEISTLPYQQTWENRDNASRAKGTWKILKTAKAKQLPIKAGSYTTSTSVGSAATELVASTGKIGPQNHQLPASEVAENIIHEPPKLTPVSGKLLLDKSSGSAIVRPTAFRPVVNTSQEKSVTASESPEDKKWDIENAESSPDDEAYTGLEDIRNSVSVDSNNSDSGRHSITSIPVPVTVGSSFSCSGSEGYESARISSSTTHSAMQDRELSIAVSSRLSPKKLSDDIVISDLESRVRENQDEVQLLRRNFEDNEKTLQDMQMYEDRMRETKAMMSLQQRHSNEAKSQAGSSLRKQEIAAERQYRIMHEEQKQLHDTNKELEDRIRSMTDAIDTQTRRNNHVAELKARLEESEIEMQQKHGEISLLKRQVKEKQAELTRRSGETIALKSHNRELNSQLSFRDSEAAALQEQLNERDFEIAELERRLTEASSRGSWSTVGSHNSSVFKTIRAGDQNFMVGNVDASMIRSASSCSDTLHDDRNYSAAPSLDDRQANGALFYGSMYAPGEREELLKRLHIAERRCFAQERQFELERRQWAEDKSKVIKYQKQLQSNYVQMYKRSHALEREVKILTNRLQALGVSAVIGMRVDDGVVDEQRDLCYPMEI